MSKYVYTVVTQGTGASLPVTDLVLTQAAGGDSAQTVAEAGAVSHNTDPSPALVISALIGNGPMDSDQTAGGFGSAYFFQVVTQNLDGSLVALRVLSKAHSRGLTAWSSGTTYAIGNTAEYSGHSYKSLQNANTNHQPDTSPTWWTLYDKSAAAVAIDAGIAAAAAGAIGNSIQLLGSKAITLDVS